MRPENLPYLTDQTPTPTRFLKNCEEVGLFNELTSPFDHDFKKAAEDDIKKVPMASGSDSATCSNVSVTVFLDWVNLSSVTLVALGSVPSRNAHHTKQNRGSHSAAGAQEQPSALPRIHYQRRQGKALHQLIQSGVEMFWLVTSGKKKKWKQNIPLSVPWAVTSSDFGIYSWMSRCFDESLKCVLLLRSLTMHNNPCSNLLTKNIIML